MTQWLSALNIYFDIVSFWFLLVTFFFGLNFFWSEFFWSDLDLLVWFFLLGALLESSFLKWVTSPKEIVGMSHIRHIYLTLHWSKSTHLMAGWQTYKERCLASSSSGRQTATRPSGRQITSSTSRPSGRWGHSSRRSWRGRRPWTSTSYPLLCPVVRYSAKARCPDLTKVARESAREESRGYLAWSTKRLKLFFFYFFSSTSQITVWIHTNWYPYMDFTLIGSFNEQQDAEERPK